VALGASGLFGPSAPDPDPNIIRVQVKASSVSLTGSCEEFLYLIERGRS